MVVRTLAAALVLGAAALSGFMRPTPASAAMLSFGAEKIVLPGGQPASPVALNDEGQTVMSTSACPDCTAQYYFWSKGTATQIGSPPGIADFQPYALDDDGWLVGYGQTGGGTGATVESFLGHVTGKSVVFKRLLNPNGSASGVLAFDINAKGDILGQSQGVQPVYYFWQSSAQKAQTLQLPVPNGDTATVSSLDDAGDFAGIVQTAQGAEGMVWLEGRTGVALPGSTNADGDSALNIGGFVTAPNNAFVYVSAYQPAVGSNGQGVATYWTVYRQTWAHPGYVSGAKTIGTLSKLDTSSTATAISPDGWVVGNSKGPVTGRAFLYHNRNLSPLRKFAGGNKAPAHVFNGVPLAINMRNQILLGDWLFTPKA